MVNPWVDKLCFVHLLSQCPWCRERIVSAINLLARVTAGHIRERLSPFKPM